ncbi:MAG: lactonase family protein [Acidimicrobiales bacterium]
MKILKPSRAAAGLLAAAGLAGIFASPAIASASTVRADTVVPSGISNAVFVQTNDTTGNQILAYSRASNGTLNFAHAYSTGGLGIALTGAVVDQLASQGSLTYDGAGSLLIAVNAGSDTITTFQVSGDSLANRRILPAGDIPVSIAVHGRLVEVLDGGGTGAVTGFRLGSRGRLHPIASSSRNLGLTEGASPQFLNTPGQVAFTPDGSQLVVTTKANGSDIDVFSVARSGQLSEAPVVNSSATGVPFGVVFDGSGRLIVAEAAASNLSSYAIDNDGSLTYSSSAADGQKALCWVAAAGGYFYGANAGSANLSVFTENALGQLSLVAANSGIAASTDGGPIDLAASTGGSYLYSQDGGAGTIDEFAVNANGSLTSLGSVTGLGGTGMEGIVAS